MGNNDFEDLSTFFDPYLPLTVRGKTYRIPEPSASTGIRLRQLVALQAMTRVDEEREALQMLGAQWVTEPIEVPVWDENRQQTLDDQGNPVMETQTIGKWAGGLYDDMEADGLSIEEIIHVGMTALLKCLRGLDFAKDYWATGLAQLGNPEPPKSGANRATKRAAKKVAAKKAPAKKATSKSSSRTSTAASTTRARGRTGRTTPAEQTTTP